MVGVGKVEVVCLMTFMTARASICTDVRGASFLLRDQSDGVLERNGEHTVGPPFLSFSGVYFFRRDVKLSPLLDKKDAAALCGM